VHPRTSKTLREIGKVPDRILLVDPQPYLEFNFLVRNARGVITDSGGVTEEATVMRVPCMTMRTTTERPETVEIGTNELLGIDPAALRPALDRLLAGQWKRGGIPPLWDGRAGPRIVEILERQLMAAGDSAPPAAC
jgi:UDP-N-acetylglucosamine 2-epimerase (non-hydrolysing)